MNNSNKVKFNRFLYTNTLANFFDEKQESIAAGNAFISLFQSDFANPKNIFGNLPLVAFDATFLTECDDSIIFKIKYIELPPEYKKTLLKDSDSNYCKTVIKSYLSTKTGNISISLDKINSI